MAIATRRLPKTEIEQLHSGDRMTRSDFHEAYLKTPEGFKAELIGGTVYVASPVSRRHGRPHFILNIVLGLYEARTPGIEALDNTTIFLNDENEPQPDLSLRIKPEFGGQSGTTPDGDYVLGAPELVIEIAYSSRSIDLHAKRAEYGRCGVKEYLVWIAKNEQFRWFGLEQDVERPIPPDGIVQSSSFPGLWLDSGAVQAEDAPRLMKSLEEGLATADHADFVRRLAEAKR